MWDSSCQTLQFSRDMAGVGGNRIDQHNQPAREGGASRLACPSSEAGWGGASERDLPGPRRDGGDAWGMWAAATCGATETAWQALAPLSSGSQCGNTGARQTDRSRPLTLLDRKQAPKGTEPGGGSSGNPRLLLLDLLSAMAGSFPESTLGSLAHRASGCSFGLIYMVLMAGAGCR